MYDNAKIQLRRLDAIANFVKPSDDKLELNLTAVSAEERTDERQNLSYPTSVMRFGSSFVGESENHVRDGCEKSRTKG